ncbi:sulfatase [Chitinophaga pendula]|uniref:sulfatase family protein n=1 Tax=Chitinophaga TaxID=79328 RepID=UPI000BB00F4C|nr:MULTISPECIES: sulfatase [Chitinophaga]ASZ12960.1 sulfatase [Chitinophaga sp. MD30]UCJ09407.1 sulfatase [Chitinophaga pendula]
MRYLLLSWLLLGNIYVAQAQTTPTTKRPNIIFIMSDDHAATAISAYDQTLIKTPNIDRLAKEGILFRNSFVTNSLCSPSRAVMLSGKFSHLTGSRDNQYAMAFDTTITTFPMRLQKAGYQTALIGKWHLVTRPQGFQYWNILPDQGSYYNPEFIEMGQHRTIPGYVTNITMDLAMQWLNQADKTQPFCLLIHNKAPHRNFMPDTSLLNECKDDLPLPATLYDNYDQRGQAARQQMMTISHHLYPGIDLKYGLRDTAGAKRVGGEWNRMTPAQRNKLLAFYAAEDDKVDTLRMSPQQRTAWRYQRYIKDYLRCIRSVDNNIGRLMAYLQQQHLMDNTIIIYTADQGFYLGEHGWFDKRFMYEQSLRNPLIIRYPPMIKAGTESRAMVQNIDYAQTLLQLAGVKAPADMQGASLVPLFNGHSPTQWRQAVYYHYYEYPGYHAVKRHYGIRTARYKLIRYYYDVNEWELFDLQKDPQELHNVFQDPAYSKIRKELTAQLTRLQAQYKDSPGLAQQILEKDKQQMNEKNGNKY